MSYKVDNDKDIMGDLYRSHIKVMTMMMVMMMMMENDDDDETVILA